MSSGAEAGCEERAESLVGRGWRCESLRVIVVAGGESVLLLVGVGLLMISQVGSRLVWVILSGCVWATMIVMDSASDSKLWIEVGVRTGFS